MKQAIHLWNFMSLGPGWRRQPKDPPIGWGAPFSQAIGRRGVENHEHRAVGLDEIQPTHFEARHAVDEPRVAVRWRK